MHHSLAFVMYSGLFLSRLHPQDFAYDHHLSNIHTLHMADHNVPASSSGLFAY
jgi:hypothetical protein